MQDAPLILWFRRDLRLADNPMLTAAAQTGRPVIPLFILDPETGALGAAPRWRLGLALDAFGKALAGRGLRLVLRQGPALEVLQGLVAETGAAGVMWGRLYDPTAQARDSGVKAALKAQGTGAESFPGFLLHEPWTVSTGEGGFYRVFTPFWKALRGREVGFSLPEPKALRGPETWPAGEDLARWNLARGMNRAAPVVAAHQAVGEAAAQARLERFLGVIGDYQAQRDRMDLPATSGLSENLTWGEIGPRQVWHAGFRAMEEGAAGAETFLKELAWREFAWTLAFHTPHILERNWKAEWDGFGWEGESPAAEAWRRGRTGEPVVDAAMRELWVTGRMHNRARMIVASYLTKHLLTDWRIGQKWFAETLTDWDPASNAMGWQWVAGCGPDAAPYFRIFNPATQAEKFDPEGRYRRHWLNPGAEGARQFLAAAPLSWAIGPGTRPPMPLIALDVGRARALAAFDARKA